MLLAKKKEFVAYCSAATYRLIHFRSCQMGRGPCRAVTLHPTSYCTVTLFVLCHSNEVLLCQKCTIPVQMRSQRAAVPLLCANSCRTGRGFDQVNSVLGTVYSIYKYQVLSHNWQWHFWCRLKQRDIALLLQPTGLDNALWANLFTLFTIKRKEEICGCHRKKWPLWRVGNGQEMVIGEDIQQEMLASFQPALIK